MSRKLDAMFSGISLLAICRISTDFESDPNIRSRLAWDSKIDYKQNVLAIGKIMVPLRFMDGVLQKLVLRKNS